MEIPRQKMKKCLPATDASVNLIITSGLYFNTTLSLDVIIAICMMDNIANIA